MAVLSAEIKRRAMAAADVLSRQGNIRAVYIFGSHIEGSPGRWSDIDVAVFIEGVETWDIRRRARAMAQVQREVGFDVEVHLFPASAHESPDPAGFAEYIQRHGVKIEIS